jgi:hypothetical protein
MPAPIRESRTNGVSPMASMIESLISVAVADVVSIVLPATILPSPWLPSLG